MKNIKETEEEKTERFRCIQISNKKYEKKYSYQKNKFVFNGSGSIAYNYYDYGLWFSF